MALVRDLSSAQLAFQVAGGEVDRFHVVRYCGTEGLCQLYRFEIELVSVETAFAFDDVVGKSAVLSINTAQGQRWFHGVISRFEMTGETSGQTYFRTELVPAVWLLTHRYNSRIFQGKTVPEIISDVLIKGGIPSDRFSLAGLERTYEARDYCCQYRETDYNFICRLMEEEGIWWYFSQSQDGHVLMLADGISAYQAIEGEAALPYQPPTGLNVEEQEHVSRFRLGQCVRPGAVVLNDFNFENPGLDLQAKCDAGRDTAFEFSDYPGEYVKQDVGTTLAGLRAEEFESGRILGVGRSNSYRFSPGKTFELTEHPSESLNLPYLLTSITHRGRQTTTRGYADFNGQSGILSPSVYHSLRQATQHEDRTIKDLAEALLHLATRLRSGDPTARRALTNWLFHAGQVARDHSNTAIAQGGSPLEALAIPNLIEDMTAGNLVDIDAPVYECRFECIPAEVSFRPPRVTPWPVMRGSQTARVVGPEGEEIHTDKYGRVKVHFNWDREGEFKETDSCWIRVSQGLAGGQYGMMFLPRVGQEVIVDFLEGDVDKPVFTGRVYNADHMPPYALPAEKTKSVIKTRSSKEGGGSNEIRFEDLKDSEQMLLYGQKDLHIRVNNDRVENVGHDYYFTVKENQFELVKKGKNAEVKLDLKEKVGGDKSLEVKGKVSEKFGGAHSINVGGDVVEKYGASHKHEVTMTYAVKALSIKLEASTGIELKCGGSSIVLTPAAIFIMGGPLVNINSGSGPPVGPVTAMASGPAAPEAPVDADTVAHGTDTRYDGGGELPEAEAGPQVAGYEFKEEEAEEKETTWIEIEMIDEAGQPVVGERYEITAPDGQTVKKGQLDRDGRAHVSIPEPGTCEIAFPDLDAEAWERI